MLDVDFVVWLRLVKLLGKYYVLRGRFRGIRFTVVKNICIENITRIFN